MGLTLAMDLAWRGVEVMVVEKRARGAPPPPKCNHVARQSTSKASARAASRLALR